MIFSTSLLLHTPTSTTILPLEIFRIHKRIEREVFKAHAISTTWRLHRVRKIDKSEMELPERLAADKLCEYYTTDPTEALFWTNWCMDYTNDLRTSITLRKMFGTRANELFDRAYNTNDYTKHHTNFLKYKTMLLKEIK